MNKSRLVIVALVFVTAYAGIKPAATGKPRGHVVAAGFMPAFQDPRQIVEEVQRRTNSGSQRYEGTIQVIDLKNKITESVGSFDRLGSHGSSKSILRFTAPAEVKGVAVLIVNHPERSSDQWMWTPALARDAGSHCRTARRVFSEPTSASKIFEERDTNQFEYRLLGVEQYDGAACWKISAAAPDKGLTIYAFLLVGDPGQLCSASNRKLQTNRTGPAREIPG